LHPLFKKQADLVAQSVEHLTFNQVVLGSNPSEITKNQSAGNTSCCLRFLFLAR
jgi:hypothetical protein